MFEKMKTKKRLSELKKMIDEIEAKRSRSQSALVQAILQQKDPSEEDAEFFNRYTQQIEAMRSEMHLLQTKLDMK